MATDADADRHRIKILEDLREAEEANFRTAIKLLGETVSLVEDVDALYDNLAALIRTSGVAPRNEVVAGANFLRAAQYHLRLAALDCLRCHITDSFSHSRMSIEAAAFAARVKRYPHLAEKWIRASENREAYDQYWKKFRGPAIFPKDDEPLAELGRRYETCAKQTHPSLYSIARRVRHQPGEGYQAEFHYFEVRDGDASEPTRTFLWIMDTHFTILKTFASVFDEAVTRDAAAWTVRVNAVDAKLALHKQRWKEVILDRPGRPGTPAAGGSG